MPTAAAEADKNSTPRRRFIGWDAPLLARTVELLYDDYGAGAQWDMRSVVVVLPSSLARRRLTELLALHAQQRQVILYPPQIVTVGSLPEQLYTAKYPFASDVVQQLAWMHVLQASPASELAELLPIPPAKSMTIPWLELGKVLSSIHRELASDRLDAQRVANVLGDHPEGERWRALAQLQREYLAQLDRLNLWDIQTARLCALDYQEARTDQQFLVVGCVDLNRTQLGFLAAISAHVQVWVAAPESQRDRFDDFGCLHGPAWQNLELELPAQSLLVGNSPADQADLTAASLAAWGDKYHAREISIGVPDKSLVPELQHRLDLAGVAARNGAGSPLSQTEPAMLLALIGRYLEQRSYQAFANLIRHPATENVLRVLKAGVPEDWLAQVDDYYQAVLPKRVGGSINEKAPGARVFQVVSRAVHRWLAKLATKPQAISQFVQPLLAVLSTAYDKQLCDVDDAIDGALYRAASQTCAEILALREIPDALQPTLALPELIDWLIGGMQGKLVSEAVDLTAVEMLGWLELAWDDSPALIVTGMHDGVVPESVNSHAFLPNNLRRQLGMMDNDRRYARDAYAMQVMLHTRQDVRFVVGKSDAQGDPLVPSRLLMACPLAQLPARVLHLVREDQVDVLPEVSGRWTARGGLSQLPIPRPEDLPPLKHISVTAFRDFLSCPYRFYLRHVLKLRKDDDASAELDAPQFGVLIHDTLALLQGPIGQVDDPRQVEQFLIDNLHRIANETYGTQPAAAVLIQIEQAELRLSAFAQQQALRAADGWQVRYVESGVDRDNGVPMGASGRVKLIGRIDRIDYHPDSGRWAIWDYKTSESAKHPVSVHWTRGKGWQDLQLPLYRGLARQLGVADTPLLGYIALPKQAADSGFHVADFSATQLAEADQVAAEIAERVADRDYWPESIQDVDYDQFARICQSGVQHVSVPPPRRRVQRPGESLTVPAGIVDEAQMALDVPESVAGSPALPPLLIRASAGTGKTFQLSNRLLQIILSGQDVDHILATTFTRKAAGEIMHRVLQRLAMACVDQAAHQELTQVVADVNTSPAACLAALRRVTSAIHRLRISTLDSFFAQVARTFSFEMSLPPGWNALDPVQEPQFQLQAINRMLDRHERKTLVTLVRMLAKGESGRRVADELRRTVTAGYSSYRVTSADAWDQLPLPEKPPEDAYNSALLTVANTKLGHKSADPQLEKLHLDARAGHWESLLGHGLYGKLRDGATKYYGRELPDDLVAALWILADRAAAEALPLRRDQTLASRQVLEAYDVEYSALIRQYRMLAFSDVTYYLSRWMSTGKASPKRQADQEEARASRARQRLEFRLDCGVHHLLLDEFQDTAPDQWQILEPLAKPLSRPGPHQSMFCVGDTKQAIYGWRGGVAEVFESVAQSMPSIEQQELRESFRSSPEIVTTVNEVFRNLERHRNFGRCESVASQWSASFPEHRTTRQDLSGYVCLQNGPAGDKDLTGDERQLAFLETTADQIAELTGRSAASVGVLFRTNADVARMIGLLRDRGVSASQDGGNPLTDSAAVQLVLSLVHLADHPGDGICRFHVLTSPLAPHLPDGESGVRPGQVDVIALAAWFRQQVSSRGLGRAIALIADKLAPCLSWWDLHRLEQLIRLAHQFAGTYSGRLREFEEAVEFQRVALPTEAQVKVMTIHASKGLEFDAVFLPSLEVDLVDGNTLLVMRGQDPCQPPSGVLRYMNASLQAMLPESWQEAFDQHRYRTATEALCLLYVAMTRARVALYMTARPNSRQSTQQFGSLLQSTLGSKELTKTASATVFEAGAPDWYRAWPKSQETSDPEETGDSSEGTTAADATAIRLRTDSDSAPVRGLRVAAPSYIGQQSRPIPLAHAFSYSQTLGATYGTLIHAFFEQIRWLDDFEFDRGELRKAALSAITPEELQLVSLERALDDFEDMLHLDSVRSALSTARYRPSSFGFTPDTVEVDCERPLSLVVEDQLISGTIDRLAVLMRDGRPYAAEIIDFKTDAFDPNMTLLWLDDRIEHHRPQLEVYAKVVAQLFQLPPERVATYLVMLSSDDFVRVDRTSPDPHFNHGKSTANAR